MCKSKISRESYTSKYISLMFCICNACVHAVVLLPQAHIICTHTHPQRERKLKLRKEKLKSMKRDQEYQLNQERSQLQVGKREGGWEGRTGQGRRRERREVREGIQYDGVW